MSMSLQSLRAAMNTWAAMSEARQRKQQALLSAASAFRGDGMRKAWNGWLGLLNDRQVMASAVFCMSLRLQRAGFASWLSATQVSQQLRSTLSSLSPAKRSMRKAINSWSEYGNTLQSVRRATAALRMREERVAFSTWHEHVCSDSERDAGMRRAVSSMLQSSMRASLNTWMSYAEEHAEMMRKFRKSAAFIINRVLSRSWLTWYLTSVELAHKKAVLRRGLRYLLSRSLARGFSAWSEMAAERSLILQTLRKVVNRLANNKLELCFVRWLTRLTVQMLATLLRSLGHKLNRDVSRAFGAWSEMAMMARGDQVTLGTASTPVQRKKLDASQSRGVSRLSRSHSYVKRKYKVLGQVLSFNLARALGSALEVVDDEVLNSGAKTTKSPKGTRVLTSFALRIKVPITVELERFSLTDVQLLSGREAGAPTPTARGSSSDTSHASLTQSLPVIHVAARYEAVYESTDCGNKVFVASIAVKPPLYPGAELTALVPPTGRRIAFVVPASVPAGARASPKHADSSVLPSSSNELSGGHQAGGAGGNVRSELKPSLSPDWSFVATAVSAAAVAPGALESAACSAPPTALGGVTMAARAFLRATAAVARVEAARAEVAKAETAKAEAAKAELVRVDAMGVAAIAVVAKVAASVVARAEVARAEVARAEVARAEVARAAVANAGATTPTMAAPTCAAIRRARMHRDNSPTAMGRCSSASPTPRAVAMDYINKLEQECSGEDQADNLWI